MIEINRTYEGLAVGGVLKELAEGEKWKRCVVRISSRVCGDMEVDFPSDLFFTNLEERDEKFYVVLEPTQPAPLNWGAWDFVWAEKDDPELGRPILKITVLAME